ncbi:hypothetical protein [Thermomonospora catenispora]|nr:hypothetical protein [Thermomonospora catenispora]
MPSGVKAAALVELLGELGIRAHTVMTAQAVPNVPQGIDPIDAWDPWGS